MADRSETSKAPCCPADALPYLDSDKSAVGIKVNLGDGAEFYQTGEPSTAAIIIFSDVWGWDSGRVRKIADELARLGYRVYVPKLLQPTFEEGTDGDGLPPVFDIAARFQTDVAPWLGKIPWSVLQPKVEKLIAYAKKDGAKQLGMVGVCWGGWACFHASAMCADFSCAVVFHPSCQLEGVHGGDTDELCKKVQCPFYFMPADADPQELYGPDGSLVKILAEKFGADKVKTKTFPEQQHGFMTRGDVAVAETKRDVQIAMEETVSYLSGFLSPQELTLQLKGKGGCCIA